MFQTIKECICPVCKKKAYLRRIRTFCGLGKLGWQCMRCFAWWEDGYYDKQTR